jgi:hypothetical protein
MPPRQYIKLSAGAQESAGEQDSASAGSGGPPAAGYAASSAASSADGDDVASASDQAPRLPRQRGGRRSNPFSTVYSGPETSCRVEGAPLPLASCYLSFQAYPRTTICIALCLSCLCIRVEF